MNVCYCSLAGTESCFNCPNNKVDTFNCYRSDYVFVYDYNHEIDIKKYNDNIKNIKDLSEHCSRGTKKKT